MKTDAPAERTVTLTLTPENSAKIAYFAELTGLSAEELINWLLADELFLNFTPDSRDTYVDETLGMLEFRNRASAERTLAWVTERFKGRRRGGKLPKKFRSNIEELSDGHFLIHAFYTDNLGEEQRFV